MPTILLVDDSPVARRVLARRLASEGFVVHEESSAVAAREMDAHVLACAIIDLELHDGDGSDLAAGLRRKQPSLPIAFFTAGASSSILARARAHGPVFMKPDVNAIVDWAKAAGQPPPTK
jgi:two-component system cell cycle sensor histidine kinase/response regulator CckA